MKGKLDIAKMEAAFKRAAHKAVHGTREERSGRFLLAKEDRTSRTGRYKALTASSSARRKGS